MNEAFAFVLTIACEKELKLDRLRVNVMEEVISLGASCGGHWGAVGLLL